MKMNQDERRFDFHGLGLALKQAREEKGWTQAYVAELVGKTDRTIMNIENKGQHIDVLLSSMNEKELVVIEATAEGLKKARETEVQE